MRKWTIAVKYSKLHSKLYGQYVHYYNMHITVGYVVRYAPLHLHTA